jgi:hypothetical protein
MAGTKNKIPIDAADNRTRRAILQAMKDGSVTAYELWKRCDSVQAGAISRSAVYAFVTDGAELKLGALDVVLRALDLHITRR